MYVCSVLFDFWGSGGAELVALQGVLVRTNGVCGVYYFLAHGLFCLPSGVSYLPTWAPNDLHAIETGF